MTWLENKETELFASATIGVQMGPSLESRGALNITKKANWLSRGQLITLRLLCPYPLTVAFLATLKVTAPTYNYQISIFHICIIFTLVKTFGNIREFKIDITKSQIWIVLYNSKNVITVWKALSRASFSFYQWRFFGCPQFF